MASPFKTTVSLLSSKRLSPRISSFQPQQTLHITPVKKQHFLSPQKIPNTFTSPLRKVTLVKEDSLILDSPHKQSLLTNGLDKHDLFYFIGKGTFGTVIKSNYKGTTVAVKLVKRENPIDPINEMNVCHFTHRNIVKINDIILSKKYGLIIMEYYENSKNLQQVLNENILNEKTVVSYSRDIASGLAYCHQNGVLHLDIKPKNVLLCESVCKICDFGNSLCDCESNFKYQGTVAYTAPELLKGLKPSPKCDIYSLGVVIWQLLSGQNPYEFLESEVIIYKVVKFDFRPLVDTSNAKLAKLCEMCWDRNPDLRPKAEQVCHMLNIL